MTAINRPVDDYASDSTTLWLTMGVVSIAERLRQVLGRADLDELRELTEFDDLLLGVIAISEAVAGFGGDTNGPGPRPDGRDATDEEQLRRHHGERWMR